MSAIIGDAGSRSGVIGEIGETREVRFYAYGGLDGTVTVANTNGVPFGQIPENVGGGMHASNGVFTAPVAGIYSFYVQIYNYSTGTNNYNWQCVANSQASAYQIVGRFHGQTAQGMMVTFGGVKWLRVNESVNITNNSGGSRNFYSGTGHHTMFVGALIRAGGAYI